MPTRLAWLVCIGWCVTSTAVAGPVGFGDSVVEALATAEAAWADTLLADDANLMPFDEQIFTEISPILDSPQGIKLPEDQLLTD